MCVGRSDSRIVNHGARWLAEIKTVSVLSVFGPEVYCPLIYRREGRLTDTELLTLISGGLEPVVDKVSLWQV